MQFPSVSILTCTGLFLLSSIITATGAEQIDVQIIVKGLKNHHGYLRMAVYDSEDNYLKNPIYKKNTNLSEIDIKSEIKLVVQLEKGIYAIAMYHDANGNGKFDKGFLGLPKEQYGFSNNVRPKLVPPPFDDVKVIVDKTNSVLVITVK